MKSWKLHFGWAIVTVLAAAVSARVASLKEAEPARPIPTAPERSAPVLVAETRNPLPVPEPVEVVETPTSAPAAPDEESLRAQIRATEDFEQLRKILQEIPQRKLKLKMLREAACSREVRCIWAAFMVLERMSGRDVAEILEASLAAQLHWTYSAQAAILLGKLGDALSYEPLTQALQSKNEDTRVQSADALRKLGYPMAAQELAIAYTRQFESADGSLRKKSVETLTHLNLEGSIAVFVRALKDSNGDVRLEAINAFSSLDKKEYLPLLEPLVNDPHPEVAGAAKDLVEGLKFQEK
jgi:HEAT repeat protein